MRVADSSFLVALFLNQDGHHSRALKDLLQPDPVVVPSEILVESFGVLASRLGPRTALAAMADLLATAHVSFYGGVNPDAAVRIWTESHAKISLADACVVQACRALGALPLAYDQGLLRAL